MGLLVLGTPRFLCPEKEKGKIGEIIDPLLEYPKEKEMLPHVHMELYIEGKDGKTKRVDPSDYIPLP